MKLQHVIEKFSGSVNQILIIETEAMRLSATSLGYDDFTARLFFSGQYIGEISDLLAKAGVWEALIDGINWDEVYAETKAANYEY